MRIINFAVNNFRAISGGLSDNRLDFNDSNTIFIFGQNNVGKSTFLAAYEFLYYGKEPTIDDFFKRDVAKQIEFELELGVDEIDLAFIAAKQEKKLESFKSFLSASATLRIKRSFSGSLVKDKPKIEKAKDVTWNPITNLWEDTAFGTIGLNQVFQHLMPTPILIKAMPTEEEIEKVVNEILASKAKSKLSENDFNALTEAQDKVKELQEKMYNPASITNYRLEVNKHFQKLFPDTNIDIEESDKVKWTEDKFGKKFHVQFQKLHEDGSADINTPNAYNSIGHGVVRSAIFSLLLMRDIAEELPRYPNRKEYLILFEEPELFLYPKILRSLRGLIYDVSELSFPYQVLCASHSPQMIDLSKRNSTLVRMCKSSLGTRLFQVKDEDLREAKQAATIDQLKQAMYEVLRFNPHICESFYADEVLLVEGPTEELLVRGILQKMNPTKDLFLVNCGTVTNIPFYQKVYRKFAIKTHVICDTDGEVIVTTDEFGNPRFADGIQATIYNEHVASCQLVPRLSGCLRVHHQTFEPAHRAVSVHETFRYPEYPGSHGKPFNANKYWTEILEPHFDDPKIATVPIFSHLKEIIEYRWE